MYPELLKIGPITIHSFGVMAMLGFLITTLILRREFNRVGIHPDIANSVAVAAVLGGFIGARLYYIIEHWHLFLEDPFAMIFSGAGLVWYGGFIGGVIAVVWTLKRHNVPILQGGDFIVPLVLLGYGIGRIGCQLAGDGDYGPPSDLPWAMAYPNGVVPTLERVHPTPIYDFLLSTLLFYLLWKLRKRYSARGQMFGLGLIALGVERFITEFFRVTPKIPALGITHAQGISILTVAAGIVLLARRTELAGAEASLQQSTAKKKKKAT